MKGRPPPEIALTHTSKHWFKTEVLVAPILYQVMYQEQGFNLRTTSANPDQGQKYRRVSHMNRAHAQRLAAELNAMFRTDEFTVREVV